MTGRVQKTVDHPWIKVAVAVMSTGAFAGMGTGFWSYMSQRETVKMESRLSELGAASDSKDIQLQLTAIMEILCDQGDQLKLFKDALLDLSMGNRAEARKTVRAVKIPMAQGKNILRGRALPTYETVEAEQTKINAELDQLEDLLKK